MSGREDAFGDRVVFASWFFFNAPINSSLLLEQEKESMSLVVVLCSKQKIYKTAAVYSNTTLFTTEHDMVTMSTRPPQGYDDPLSY